MLMHFTLCIVMLAGYAQLSLRSVLQDVQQESVVPLHTGAFPA